MTELLQSFEDLFTVVLYRLLPAFQQVRLPTRSAGTSSCTSAGSSSHKSYSTVTFNFVPVMRPPIGVTATAGTRSAMNELSTDEVIHCECGGVHRELRQVLGLAANVHAQAQVLNSLADGFHQSHDDRALHAGPIRDLVDNGLAMLTQHFVGSPHALAPLGGDIEDVRQVGIERQFLHRNLLRQAETIELADRRFHLVDGDIGAAATPDGFDVADFSRNAIDELELGQRAPTLVALAPLRARREPDRKSFRKIFIRMLQIGRASC